MEEGIKEFSLFLYCLLAPAHPTMSMGLLLEMIQRCTASCCSQMDVDEARVLGGPDRLSFLVFRWKMETAGEKKGYADLERRD